MTAPPPEGESSLDRFRGPIGNTLAIASLVYGSLGAVYLIAPPLHPGSRYALASIACGLALLALSLLVRRVQPRRIPDIALAGGLCAEFHALSFLFLTGDPVQSVVLVIVLLAVGFLIPFPLHTAVLVAAGLVGWLAAILLAPAEFAPGHFVHWVVNLCTTGLLALFFCVQRWLALRSQDDAEAALRESEARFRGMAESSPLAVLLLSPAGERIYANAPFERLLGAPTTRPSLAEMLHPDDRERVVRAWAEALRCRTALQLTHRVQQPGGDIRWLSVQSAPVRDGARFFGFVVTSEDVTDRIRAEEALRHQAVELERSSGRIQRQADELASARDVALAATRAKSEFLARMSHEIRTPMNVIFGMTEMIAESGGLSTDQAEQLQRVRRAASGLLELMNDVLDLSKIEAGKMTLSVRDLDVAELLYEVADLLAPEAFDKGVEFLCRVPPGFPSLLRADPLRLRQVLINLAANAVKFTDRGVVALALELDEETATAVRFRVVVTDTGIGIARARQDAIFESFNQADAGIGRRFGGTGLGLAICRQIVELIGGRIDLRSEPGAGSTFSVSLSLAKQGVTQPRAERGVLRGYRVRLVEPVAATRDALREHLLAWGCVVDVDDEAPVPASGAAARWPRPATGSPVASPSVASPSVAGPSLAEPSGASPSVAGPSAVEPSVAGPCGAGPAGVPAGSSSGALFLLAPSADAARDAPGGRSVGQAADVAAIVRLVPRTIPAPAVAPPATPDVPVEIVWKPVRPAELLAALERLADLAPCASNTVQPVALAVT